jgi:uncharacterized protein YkwD
MNDLSTQRTRRERVLVPEPRSPWRAGLGRLLGLPGLVLLLLVVVLPAALPATRAHAAVRHSAGGPESTLLGLVNRARVRHGRSSLRWSPRLAAVAERRAQIMARTHTLSHTPNLGRRVCGETWVGENSGYGGNVAQVHQLFMNSAPHRSNILHPASDDVGLGVVRAAGAIWVTEVFRARASGGCTP